jgi:urease subunit alpha
MSGAYGPSEGDVLVLGDTRLRLRVTSRVPDSGDELHVGFAKTGRDGIGMKALSAQESCDVLLTNVVVLDPVDGVRLACIGIRDGRISGIGRAG